MQTSHQSWKLFGGFIILFGGFVVMAFGLAHLQDHDGFAITLAGIAICLGGPIPAALSIRCPACGARWLWLAVGTQGALTVAELAMGADCLPALRRRPGQERT